MGGPSIVILRDKIKFTYTIGRSVIKSVCEQLSPLRGGGRKGLNINVYFMIIGRQLYIFITWHE